jgi:Domain of unknown function DUF29
MSDDLYERDFYRWAIEQAAAVRDKHGELEALGIDWLNLAEELETLGRSEKRELQSRLQILLLHLLKWRHQPMHQGTSWRLTLEEQRDASAEVLASNPSLKASLDEILKEAYRHACRSAVVDTGLHPSTFPPVCPWTATEVLDPHFLP